MYFKYPEEDSSSIFIRGKGITVNAIKINLTQIKHTDKSDRKNNRILKNQKVKENKKLLNIKIKNRKISFHTIFLLIKQKIETRLDYSVLNSNNAKLQSRNRLFKENFW